MPDEIYCQASRNIVDNLYFLAGHTGRGITNIEKSAGCGSGMLAMAKKRNSSFTLRTALRLAKSVNLDLESIMMDPKEFKKEYTELWGRR